MEATQTRIPTVNIRRTHLVGDGWEAINSMGPGLRRKIAIRFIDAQGRPEAGVDMGGPFKEFLETLCSEVFRPEYGLFRPSSSLLSFYPNPDCVLLPDWQEQMEFVGKILGKAMMEGHLVDVRFASFFLNLLLSRPPHFDDLMEVDMDLWKNLRFVKSYQGDVKDLGLTFAVSSNHFGKQQTIPLVSGGDEVEVTNENRVNYVMLMADYHLTRKIHPQTAAFRRGLFSVVSVDWMKLFTHQELKVLMSGSEDAFIDVDDLRKHSQIDPRGSFPSPTVLSWFWTSVKKLSEEQKRLLLKFVTACSSPPLLGFKHLNPPFTIRFVPLQESRSPSDRKSSSSSSSKRSIFSRIFGRNPAAGQLPTSATCFNMLKLPLYKSQKALSEKLIMAIEAKAGFDLQ
uniref:HECT-type E3 ubiquitin transferase n=1 Tax=Lotharella oceanica TaxID=641309 RepID=A0A7S2XI29_9EUKA